LNLKIKNKISLLFQYRRLPWLIEQSINNKKRAEALMERLIYLQYKIFLYDDHLEQNAMPDERELERLWEDIRMALKDTGVSYNETEEYLEEIRIYAENELATRKGKDLSDLPMRYFYYYKSCDVRLMRRLILEKADQVVGCDLKDWKIFDWITEVNDDVEDIIEDLETFNGNRFLFRWKKVGGTSATREYMAFLDELEDELVIHEQANGHSFITSWAREELKSTRDLVRSRQSLVLDTMV
jgi:hypothetical protein